MHKLQGHAAYSPAAATTQDALNPACQGTADALGSMPSTQQQKARYSRNRTSSSFTQANE
jgi:hypothetical protein